jgi:hypothetical protein
LLWVVITAGCLDISLARAPFVYATPFMPRVDKIEQNWEMMRNAPRVKAFSRNLQ